ncbi:MAG: NERD domain-containing protein [bacterium]
MAEVLTSDNTLTDWEDSLDKESSILGNLIYVELVVGVLAVAGGGIYYYLTDQMGWLIVGGVLLFFAVSHHIKTKENKTDMGRIKGGRRGEEFATRIFKEKLPDNCYILNDLDVHDGQTSAQNDHVIVSPYGLFVIETKAYGGTLSGSADDDKWQQIKEYKGSKSKGRVTNPITQNAYHIKVLNRFIENNNLSFEPEDVHSYVAMVNKYMKLEIDGDTSMVDMVWKLPDKMKKKMRTEKYSPGEIAEFLKALDITPPDSLYETKKEEEEKMEEKKQATEDRGSEKKEYGDLSF